MKGLQRSLARGPAATADIRRINVPISGSLDITGVAATVDAGTFVIGGLPQGNLLFLGAVAYAQVDAGADIHVIGSNGWTALTIAAAKGHLELVQWLIALGADAQVRDVYRYTPLMRAVENNHESVVALLLSLAETDVNVQDESDNTSLHHAVSAGHVAMVRLLLQHGANPAIQNRYGMTAVELADGNPELQSLFR